MSLPPAGSVPEPSPLAVYSLAASDPSAQLVDRTGLTAQDERQIDAIMGALGRLRAAERRLAEASRRYMELGETDMRAIHHLIACEATGTVATAVALSRALEISPASTTKLLDRLERGGHIRRRPHPSDRRALAVEIVPETREVARRTVGAVQARRVEAVRRLDPAEREVVVRFLEDMTDRLSLDGVAWAEGAGDPPAG